MKDFLSILNHLLQAYIVLCISLLFKDNLQVNRFVLQPIFFSIKRDYMENFQLAM